MDTLVPGDWCTKPLLDAPINGRARPGELLVPVGEAFNTKLDTERYVEGEDPGRGQRLGVPPSGVGLFGGERLVVLGFLLGLAAAVATVTGFKLRDPEELPLPVQPLRGEMRNLTASKPETAGEQTDATGFEPAWLRQSFTSRDQPFELPIREGVMMGVACCQLATMAIGPLVTVES